MKVWFAVEFFKLMKVSGWLALASIMLTLFLTVPFGESHTLALLNAMLIVSILVAGRLEGRWFHN